MTQPETNNYLATNFFKLELEKFPSVAYFCQSVNLPSLTVSTMEVPAPALGVPIKSPVGRYSYENMSVSFLVDEKMDNWLEVYNWMYDMSTAETDCRVLNPYNKILSDATLTIMDGSYTPMKRVIIKDIFPVGISGIQFSSVVVDTEPVIATVTFAFTTYEFRNA
jgi:hypothetical protein|tara:strand:+ start:200 stop:694 length:495 start_codon:yes stop_codon:yes gene_type:complete